MPATAIRVGIVSWNTAALLDRCLATLPAALAGCDFEVVVVDNDSSDDSAGMVAKHPGVTLIRNPANVGYARAMNQALGGTDAPVLIALNPDTEAPPGSLTRLADRLLADPGTALVGPQLVGPQLVDGHVVAQYTARRFPSLAGAAAVTFIPVRYHDRALGRRLLLEAATPPAEATDVDWVIGAVHVIRASALAGRLPYDERWFMYAEDIELCWWLHERGWRCRLEADITVAHVGNASGSQAWAGDYDRRCLDAIYDWYQRDRGSAEVRAWAALNTLGVVTRALFGSALGRDRDHVAWLWHVAPYHGRVLIRGAPPRRPSSSGGGANLGGYTAKIAPEPDGARPDAFASWRNRNAFGRRPEDGLCYSPRTMPVVDGPPPARVNLGLSGGAADSGVQDGQMRPPMQAGELHWAYDNPRDEVTVLVPPGAVRVLDVGCSTGVMAESLRRRGHRVTGIEYEPDLAEVARSRTDHLVVGDVEAMARDGSDPGGPFDCVVLADVLEHLRDPWAVTRWAARLLSADGCLVISVPNIRHAETFWTLAVRKRWPYKDVGIFDRTHLRFFARHNLVGLLGGTDLEIVELHRSYLLTHDQSRVNRAARFLGDLGTLQFIFRAEVVRSSAATAGDAAGRARPGSTPGR